MAHYEPNQTDRDTRVSVASGRPGFSHREPGCPLPPVISAGGSKTFRRSSEINAHLTPMRQ